MYSTAIQTTKPTLKLDRAGGQDAEASEALDLRFEDSGQDDLFNQILWRMIKGDDVPYPGPSRMSALEWKRGR